MVKPNIFSITLSRRHGSYLPGEIVSGNVTLELLEQMTVKGISFRARGKERVSITEGSGKYQKTYTEEANLFENITSLFNPESATAMLPNRYTYPFQFCIPAHCKTSFQGKNGVVDYKIRCRINIPRGFDIEETKMFTVTRPVDLNYCFEYAREPLGFVDSKTFCCCCCASEEVTGEVQINKKAFVCGEAIRITGQVTNPTDQTLSISAEFTREVKYFIRSHEASHSDTLYQEEIAEVKSGVTAIDELFPVPPCCPQATDFPMDHCSITYELKVNMMPSGCGMPLSYTFPINIGTIPHHTPGSFISYKRKPKEIDGIPVTNQPVPMVDIIPDPREHQIPPVSLVPRTLFKRHQNNSQGKPDETENKMPPNMRYYTWYPSYPFYSWEDVYFTWGFSDPQAQPIPPPGCRAAQEDMFPQVLPPADGMPPEMHPQMTPPTSGEMPPQHMYPQMAPPCSEKPPLDMYPQMSPSTGEMQHQNVYL